MSERVWVDALSGLWNVKCQFVWVWVTKFPRDLPEQNQDEQWKRIFGIYVLGLFSRGDRPDKDMPSRGKSPTTNESHRPETLALFSTAALVSFFESFLHHRTKIDSEEQSSHTYA